MDLYVIRRAGGWADLDELFVTGAESIRVADEDMPDRVRAIRVYVVREADGRIGTFCVYEARDGASIEEHSRRVGMPCDAFHPVEATVVVRSDPAEKKAA